MTYRVNFGGLTGQTLDEGWGLMPDPMQRHQRQKWWCQQRRGGEFFPSYDDAAFWPTVVPGSFNRVHPELSYYEGTVVYLNHFEARPVRAGERAWLHFGAVADRCRVFLNGRLLGMHDGGYSAFTLDASAALRERNRLLVVVESGRSESDAPSLMHDWFHDGGIHRPVRLFYRPAAFVREVAVTTEVDEAQVYVDLRVLVEDESRDAARRAEVTLFDRATGATVARCALACRPGSWTSGRVALPREAVRLWSPQSPTLYRLDVTFGEDHWHDVVGLREVRVAGRTILLNGEPIVLRGVNAFTEDPQRGIFSMGSATAERTVALLNDLHVNFARAGHRPNSAELVRACDEAGILLWMEVPAYWHRTVNEPAPTRRALHALEAMIAEHRNAASVVMWSVGNESLVHQPEQGESNLEYFIEAASFVREHDPSRLVTYAGGIEGETAVDLERDLPQPMRRLVDVVSVNSYAGIHEGTDSPVLTDFDDHARKLDALAATGKPVILTEAGIDGVRGEAGFDFGEARQATYHQKLQALFLEAAGDGRLQGMCLFVLNDYRTPIKLTRFQRGYNRKGLVTEALEPKMAYEVVKEGYAQAARQLAADCAAAQSAPV